VAIKLPKKPPSNRPPPGGIHLFRHGQRQHPGCDARHRRSLSQRQRQSQAATVREEVKDGQNEASNLGIAMEGP